MDTLKLSLLLVGTFCLSEASPLSPDELLGFKFANHSCEVQDRQRQTDGFVSYDRKQISCKSLVPEDFAIAVCEDRCRDPVKRKPLSKKLYIPEEVKYFQRFSTRSGDTFDESFTLSCRCVATKRGLKKMEARRQREYRRRQQH